MQYRSPVGGGPSSNTCPRCPSHSRQLTAVRTSIRLPSTLFTTFSFAIGSQKLGQPVPESNLVLELNSARSHPAQRKIPLSSRFQYAPVNARSVSSCRSTQYASFESFFLHSASARITLGTVTVRCRSPASENCTIVTVAGPWSAASGSADATVARRRPQKAPTLPAQ